MAPRSKPASASGDQAYPGVARPRGAARSLFSSFRNLAPLVGLLLAGASGGWALEHLGFPAGWMLGAMGVGVALALTLERLPKVPDGLQALALAVMGVRLGSTVGPEMLPVLGGLLPVLALFTLGLLTASTVAGLILARLAKVSRATGILAFVPGGASAMVAMSGEVGADARFVATVQYVRLILVGLSAPLVAALAQRLGEPAAGPVAALPLAAASTAAGGGVGALFPQGVTYAALLGGLGLSRRLPLPAGGMLLPMGLVLGATLLGWPHAPLPALLADGSFVVLGLWVGLQFDRPALRRAGITALWAVLLTLGLVGVGLLLGFGVHGETGVGLETALLGTTPGAIDTMTAVALDLSSQPALVLAMQLFRMLGAVAVGPPLVRALAASGSPGRAASRRGRQG